MLKTDLQGGDQHKDKDINKHDKAKTKTKKHSKLKQKLDFITKINKSGKCRHKGTHADFHDYAQSKTKH